MLGTAELAAAADQTTTLGLVRKLSSLVSPMLSASVTLMLRFHLNFSWISWKVRFPQSALTP